MEGPISFWGYKEQESNLILLEHDDDDDDDKILLPLPALDPRTVHLVAWSQYTLRFCDPLLYFMTSINSRMRVESLACTPCCVTCTVSKYVACNSSNRAAWFTVCPALFGLLLFYIPSRLVLKAYCLAMYLNMQEARTLLFQPGSVCGRVQTVTPRGLSLSMQPNGRQKHC